MDERFIRTKLLIGSEKLDILRTKHVAVFGVGGVGGYVCEALARCGIGRFTIVDRDTVNESNINRQIIALTSTVGRAKVDVMKERMCDINPDVYIEACEVFYLPQNASEFDFTKYDYVVDALGKSIVVETGLEFSQFTLSELLGYHAAAQEHDN